MKLACVIGGPRLLLVAVALVLAGCGRGEKVNSDPGPGAPSRASGGAASVRVDPNRAAPEGKGTDPTTGKDSTGRPSDASGGTTAAGAGSGTSGTITENKAEQPKAPAK